MSRTGRSLSLSSAVLAATAGLATAAPTPEDPAWGVHPDGDAPAAFEVGPATAMTARLGSRANGSWDARGDVLSAQFVFTGSDPEGDSPSDIAFTDDGIDDRRRAPREREPDPVGRRHARVRGGPDQRARPVGRRDARRVEGGRRVPRNGRRVDRRSEHAGRDRGDPRRAGAGLGLDQPRRRARRGARGVRRRDAIIDIATRPSSARPGHRHLEPALVLLRGARAVGAVRRARVHRRTRLFNVDLGADEVQFIDAATGAVNRIPVADSPFRVRDLRGRHDRGGRPLGLEPDADDHRPRERDRDGHDGPSRSTSRARSR
jgi:hypothetical protein